MGTRKYHLIHNNQIIARIIFIFRNINYRIENEWTRDAYYYKHNILLEHLLHIR